MEQMISALKWSFSDLRQGANSYPRVEVDHESDGCLWTQMCCWLHWLPGCRSAVYISNTGITIAFDKSRQVHLHLQTNQLVQGHAPFSALRPFQRLQIRGIWVADRVRGHDFQLESISFSFTMHFSLLRVVISAVVCRVRQPFHFYWLSCCPNKQVWKGPLTSLHYGFFSQVFLEKSDYQTFTFLFPVDASFIQ